MDQKVIIKNKDMSSTHLMGNETIEITYSFDALKTTKEIKRA